MREIKNWEKIANYDRKKNTKYYTIKEKNIKTTKNVIRKISAQNWLRVAKFRV